MIFVHILKDIIKAKKAIKTLGLMADEGSALERYANAEIRIIDKMTKKTHKIKGEM